MAKLEAPEETGQQSHAIQRADVVIGIPGPVDAQRLESLAAGVPAALGPGLDGISTAAVTVLYPAQPGSASGATTGTTSQAGTEAGGMRLVSYDLHGAINPQLPWLGQ